MDESRPAVGVERVDRQYAFEARRLPSTAMQDLQQVLQDVEYCVDAYATCIGSDALVLVTEWNQFRALDMKKVKTLLKAPKIADLRNIYEPGVMRELGFEYVGVGR